MDGGREREQEATQPPYHKNLPPSLHFVLISMTTAIQGWSQTGGTLSFSDLNFFLFAALLLERLLAHYTAANATTLLVHYF